MTAAGLRIGLALGSGAARGWAHIGVIRTLAEAGVTPDIVCGTSIGALVGAAYVAGELDRLEAWVRSLKLQTVVSFLDFSLGGGLIKGEKLIDFFRAHFVDRDIGELDRPFGAVATDLARGREVWLREGGVSDAVRASIALPGLFAKAQIHGLALEKKQRQRRAKETAALVRDLEERDPHLKRTGRRPGRS